MNYSKKRSSNILFETFPKQKRNLNLSWIQIQPQKSFINAAIILKKILQNPGIESGDTQKNNLPLYWIFSLFF